MDYVKELIDRLSVTPCNLVGCVRQNLLLADAPEDYRNIRGNALLALIGERVLLDAPSGAFHVFTFDEGNGPVLLLFRGGKPKPWWDEDARVLLAVVNTYGFRCYEAVILYELDSRLYSYRVPAPSTEMAKSIIAERALKYRTFARISKKTYRGRVICSHCPVKAECDRVDMERNETSDWPEGYQPGPKEEA